MYLAWIVKNISLLWSSLYSWIGGFILASQFICLHLVFTWNHNTNMALVTIVFTQGIKAELYNVRLCLNFDRLLISLWHSAQTERKYTDTLWVQWKLPFFAGHQASTACAKYCVFWRDKLEHGSVLQGSLFALRHLRAPTLEYTTNCCPRYGAASGATPVTACQNVCLCVSYGHKGGN